MRVLYAVSELSPLYKRGGLGDVAGSLPKAIHELKVDIRVVIPYYQEIDRKRYRIPLRASDRFSLPFGDRRQIEYVQLFETVLPGTPVPVLLLENPKYFGAYESKGEISILSRFIFFSEALVYWYARQLMRHGWVPDLFHLNDWHVGLVSRMLAIHAREGLIDRVPKTLLTIHNLSYQGVVSENVISSMGHEKTEFEKGDFVGKYLDLLKLGIGGASYINTVSPTYAREILTPEYGEHLDKFLTVRETHLVGILNGIDESYWDTENDQFIRYHKESKGNLLRRLRQSHLVARFKRLNKQVFTRGVGLPFHPDVPLFISIGRIESNQKGIEILLHALEDLLPKERIQVAILGTGDSTWEDKIHRLVHHYRVKKAIVFIDRFDEPLAHQAYAGGDFILVPSKFEPCGLVQMIAMRYGTIPVVRATGGLVDSVEQGKTGIVFRDYSAKSLTHAVREAISLYYDAKAYEKMVREGMKKDFSWKKSAKEYVKLYKKILSR